MRTDFVSPGGAVGSRQLAPDADLVAVVQAWPSLLEEAKAAILDIDRQTR